MTLDLFDQLQVVSSATAHAGCPMRYRIVGVDEVIVVFGRGRHEFELALDGGALRELVRLGAEALTRMDTHMTDHSHEHAHGG